MANTTSYKTWRFKPAIIRNLQIIPISSRINLILLVENYSFRVPPVGLGDLGVTCSPRDPGFAGSNPAEVDGFFQDVKILNTNPPGGTLSRGFRVSDFWLEEKPQA